jgi:hypothetical protein
MDEDKARSFYPSDEDEIRMRIYSVGYIDSDEAIRGYQAF